jgi:hypothetical protein
MDMAKRDSIGDETFMSAEQLRDYMKHAKSSRDVGTENLHDPDEARKALIKSLSKPIEVTPEKLHEVTESLVFKVRKAAERGETELLVMRFPNELCSDRGRAINNAEADWPESLTGRPRQAYEFWRDHLRSAGYSLTAMIVDWPGGLPGDVGIFLNWGDEKK